MWGQCGSGFPSRVLPGEASCYDPFWAERQIGSCGARYVLEGRVFTAHECSLETPVQVGQALKNSCSTAREAVLLPAVSNCMGWLVLPARISLLRLASVVGPGTAPASVGFAGPSS